MSNVERIRLDQMNPAPYNPRKDLQPGDPEYENLMKSMEEFGDVGVIVWNRRTGNIVGGHQRYKVLKAKGEVEADVKVVDVELDREKVLNLALNNISGKNDDAKLNAMLDEMSQKDRELSGVDLRAYFKDLEERMKKRDDVPEIVFTEELHEENNFVVLTFDTDVDWLHAMSILGLQTVASLDKENMRRFGVGRVLKGVDALKRIREEAVKYGNSGM